MKAVILAAGQGRRLAPMGWDKPKCLLPCRDGTLLDNILQSVLDHGIHDFVIVVGYRRELVEGAVVDPAVNCEFVINDEYATTNTVHSLWLARQYLDDGILYFNGDVWFERSLIALLLRQPQSALAIDVRPCGVEEVKVRVDRAGRISRIGKDVPLADALGEFIGVARFDPPVCAGLVESLRRYDEEPDRRKLFFESALNDILDRHAFLAVPIGNLRAVEIDTPEDYARAQSLWTR